MAAGDHGEETMRRYSEAQARLDALTKTYIEQAGPLKEALINAGARTVIAFLQDPDGYWIEVNDDKF